MGIGSKIKEFRNKAGLTQKDLADRLHITYQAVSRWENDDAEPSFDMLKDICVILNCTTDELFEIEKKVDSEEEKKEEVKLAPEIKPILAICQNCSKAIYENNDLRRSTKEIYVKTGRTAHKEVKQVVLCKECDEKRIAHEKQVKAQEEQERRDAARKRRIHSFIWPSLVLIVLVVIGIVSFTKGLTQDGILFVVAGVLGFTFLGTMILNNTFITEMWMEISSWGFVKLPGLIVEFSLDGLIWMIMMKVLFFVLGFILAALAVIFATGLAMVLSVFVYPFALHRNIKKLL